MQHIIQTAISGKEGDRGRKKSNDPLWLAKRIEIFKSWTLKSLLNQTNKNFLHWISFRVDDENKKEVNELKDYLEAIGYNFVFTFFGLPYYDTHGLNLRQANPRKKIETYLLKDRIKFSLETLGQILKKTEPIYFTVLDSDDLFHKEAVAEIQTQSFQPNSVLFFGNGYVFNILTNQLSFWNPGRTPPFFTFLFDTKTFWDYEKNFQFVKKGEVHSIVARDYPSVQLSQRKYLVLIHGQNDSTKWSHSYRSKSIIDIEEAIKILKDFGIICEK